MNIEELNAKVKSLNEERSRLLARREYINSEVEKLNQKLGNQFDLGLPPEELLKQVSEALESARAKLQADVAQAEGILRAIENKDYTSAQVGVAQPAPKSSPVISASDNVFDIDKLLFD